MSNIIEGAVVMEDPNARSYRGVAMTPEELKKIKRAVIHPDGTVTHILRDADDHGDDFEVVMAGAA